jgi:uncharacterized membrane protein
MPSIESVATFLFGLALLHTFAARLLHRLGERFPKHEGLFHLLGEVEVVFGFWSMVLVLAMAALSSWDAAIGYIESRKYTEPLFVFVIMVIAGSHPVMESLRRAIDACARVMPLRRELAVAWLCLAVLPLVGSLVTEPAAMTMAALLLAPRVFCAGVPEPLKYFALGVLFVNISIGGTLTSYAAPPVLMVAGAWKWDTAFMAANFGWKAALAVLVNATAATWLLRRHLRPDQPAGVSADAPAVPRTVQLVHLLFLVAVVLTAHHSAVFFGLFLFFLGFTSAYARYQQPLLLKEALLVAFFLAGLVVLGGMQEWWLQPLISDMHANTLFFGALGLTALTDNAALTYLGSLIEGLPDASKYALVAGAVAGGGLTVIANAPNPAGVALLRGGFQDGTVGAVYLLLGALAPTAVAAAAFLFL